MTRAAVLSTPPSQKEENGRESREARSAAYGRRRAQSGALASSVVVSGKETASRRAASAPRADARAPRAATRARARATTTVATTRTRRAWHRLSHATPSSMSRGSSAARAWFVFRAIFFLVSTDTPPDDVSLADETACAIERKKVRAFAALVDPDGSASASRSSLGLLPSARRAARCGSRGAPFGAGSTPLSPAATTPAGPRGANGWLVQVSSREPRSAATEPRF